MNGSFDVILIAFISFFIHILSVFIYGLAVIVNYYGTSVQLASWLLRGSDINVFDLIMIFPVWRFCEKSSI